MTSRLQPTNYRPQQVPKNRVGFVLFLLALVCASRAVALQPIRTFPELTLVDGRHFVAVEIINYTTNGVLARHSLGATVFRLESLPEGMLAALHLQGSQAEVALARTEYLSLADKPAVTEVPVVVAPDAAASTPAGLDMAVAGVGPDSVAIADPVATAGQVSPAATPEPVVLAAAENPGYEIDGEGNLRELSTAPRLQVKAAPASHVDVAGRIVVTVPPAGTRFLGNVEVRAYPAELLEVYIANARAKSRDAAQRLMEQAGVAAREGRAADYQALLARAERAAGSFVEYLPLAPVNARSDGYGNFTLRHNLRDIRVVATGRVDGGRGEWTFEWVGITPEGDLLLTEMNATSVVPAVMDRGDPARFSSR